MALGSSQLGWESDGFLYGYFSADIPHDSCRKLVVAWDVGLVMGDWRDRRPSRILGVALASIRLAPKREGEREGESRTRRERQKDEETQTDNIEREREREREK